ncbi:hypothetical protein Leryth_025085 [Lithospermum erythrorhizon]|nr:hypothetical protein Leryth_025085 [Lithospermum erythrorhizon]
MMVIPEHQRTILERLLPYHPECEKKIGSGVDYITIGYHPGFGQDVYYRKDELEIVVELDFELEAAWNLWSNIYRYNGRRMI